MRRIPLGLCPRIAQLFVPHILYHLACSLMAYILHSNSCYFLRQEKCKLIGNEFASISIQVGRIRWIKSCWGKRINTARKDRGWTSERLSEACNINATYLRQIESGAKTPSLQVFVTLCSTLNVSPTYLLADNLNLTESQDLDSLLALCRSATPKQINMIVAMVRSALESVE